MRSPLSATYDLLLEFNRASDVEALYDVLLKHCVRYGVSSVLAGIIPRKIIKLAEQWRYVVLGQWPPDWAERYFDKQYVLRDLTILHCTEETSPLRWSDMRFRPVDSAAKRIMEEAREFRLVDGVSFPQLTVDGHRIGASFSGDRLDRSPRALSDLTAIASFAVARALQIRATFHDNDPIRLSPRERECLLWASEGKTISDIADILDVTDSAVEKRLATARVKLSALTTTQAVVLALRSGLLG